MKDAIMGNFVPKEATGSVWPNEKRDNDRQPSWRGDFMLNGTRYRVAMWDRDTSGKSMKIEPYHEREQSQLPRKEPSRSEPLPAANYGKPFSDDIPF